MCVHSVYMYVCKYTCAVSGCAPHKYAFESMSIKPGSKRKHVHKAWFKTRLCVFTHWTCLCPKTCVHIQMLWSENLTYALTYPLTHARTRKHTHTHTPTRKRLTYSPTHSHMQARTNTHTHTHTHKHAHTHTNTHARTHARARAHTHTHTPRMHARAHTKHRHVRAHISHTDRHAHTTM
jgi:hypothetical protein